MYEYCSVTNCEEEYSRGGVKLTWIDSVIRENDLQALSQAQGTEAWDLPGGRQYGTSSSRRLPADTEEK